MGFARKLSWSAFTFSLVTVVTLALHYSGYNLFVPAVYHFSTYSAGSSYLAFDPLSVANVVTFLFLSTLLFFGYLAPFASAYVAAQLLSAVLQGQLNPLEFLIIIPAGASLSAGLLLSNGLSNDFNHRGIVYSDLKNGLILFAVAVVLTGVFMVFRLQLLAT